MNYENLFKLIQEYLDKSFDNNIIIAIDGPSAGGKTSLSKILSEKYDCNIFHMDDFFLKQELKTAERLSTPGGNVNYEDVRDNLLTPLTFGDEFVYNIYSCKTGTTLISDKTKIKKINFVEGVYSHHPELLKFYDLKVFLDVDRNTQLQRILQRSNEFILNRFKNEWIPLEDLYFEKLNIRENSDLIINTTELF